MLELTGDVYFDLTVLAPTGTRDTFGNSLWHCICICGVRCVVDSNKLRTGNKKSCGCRDARVTTARNKARTVHGHSCTSEHTSSRTYSTWCSMIARCERENNHNYPQYGGRGIKVCARWRNSFKSFLEDMGERPPKTTLDRKDTNSDYELSNCRWSSSKEQQRNRRDNVLLTLNGETLCIAAWSERLGLKSSCIRMRKKHGLSDVDCLRPIGSARVS